MMSTLTNDHRAAPAHFGLTLPGWWPRVEPVADPGDLVPEELGPEQAEALSEMYSSVKDLKGTRMVSVMMSAEEQPQAMGVMYVNHSPNVGRIMTDILGADATAAASADSVHSAGKLHGVNVTQLELEGPGAVSCVTSRRAPSPTIRDGRESLIRAYLIPQPHSMHAVLVLYMTAYHDEVAEPFTVLCDNITSTFHWHWAEQQA